MVREITLHDADGEELTVEVDLAYGAPWPLTVTATVAGSPVVMGIREAEYRLGMVAGRVDAMVQDYFCWG